MCTCTENDFFVLFLFFVFFKGGLFGVEEAVREQEKRWFCLTKEKKNFPPETQRCGLAAHKDRHGPIQCPRRRGRDRGLSHRQSLGKQTGERGGKVEEKRRKEERATGALRAGARGLSKRALAASSAHSAGSRTLCSIKPPKAQCTRDLASN